MIFGQIFLGLNGKVALIFVEVCSNCGSISAAIPRLKGLIVALLDCSRGVADLQLLIVCHTHVNPPRAEAGSLRPCPTSLRVLELEFEGHRHRGRKKQYRLATMRTVEQEARGWSDGASCPSFAIVWSREYPLRSIAQKMARINKLVCLTTSRSKQLMPISSRIRPPHLN